MVQTRSSGPVTPPVEEVKKCRKTPRETREKEKKPGVFSTADYIASMKYPSSSVPVLVAAANFRFETF
jgi:hypothetical protein